MVNKIKIKLIEFLRCNSDYSTMRLGFISCVWGALFIGFVLSILDIIINKGKNIVGVAGLVTGILGFAFYGKQKQTQFELKDKNKEDKE